MEIPFVVNARKDTGLFNSKIAIWLFLASEVMLFGGLFSGYIFLRVYADFPWPERVLPIVPGLLNTFILILSSVTVVFAWAMLKLGKWGMFRIFMGITLACAAVFMGFKVVEYKAKFEHQGVRLPDYTILEGHVHKGKIDAHGKVKHLDINGDEVEHHVESHKSEKGGEKAAAKYQKSYLDKYVFDTKTAIFDLKRYDPGYIENLIEQAATLGSEVVFTDDIHVVIDPNKDAVVVANAGDPVTVAAINNARAQFKKAVAHNAKLRTAELRRQWRVAKHKNPDAAGWENAKNINIDPSQIEGLISISSTVEAKVSPHAVLLFPAQGVSSATESSIKRADNTVLSGKLKESSMELGIDSVDFTFLVMQAEEKGIDPDEAVEKSWILKHSPEVKSAWEKHKVYIAELEAELLEQAGEDEEKAKKPTELERYRMTWKDLVRHGTDGEIDLQWYDGFVGANHKNKEWADHFPDIVIPREQIAFESKFTPRWNNYYAIYFTITGLHGLHIIGGAIVLGYYMFCPNMFRTNPEWLANRVEVAGLFWHFVDLVWIFLFPILYLM